LLHTFLSPIANRRRDAYGGDINGRMRLALEIAERVRTAWPLGKPLFFRISAVDWREDLDARTDGWTIADSSLLARELAARGVDLIDCSSGGIRAENSMIDYAKRRRPLKRNYQVPYAQAIRRETGVATMAVGAILDGPQAEAILQRGQADLVAITAKRWSIRIGPCKRPGHWALTLVSSSGRSRTAGGSSCARRLRKARRACGSPARSRCSKRRCRRRTSPSWRRLLAVFFCF
jgi:hypothetical protein